MNIPLLLINLKNRPERLKNTLKILEELNICDFITRVNACDKDEVIKHKFRYMNYLTYKNITGNIISTFIPPTWGAVACGLSHKKCWRYIVKNNLNYAIICEDDLLISDKNKFLFSFNMAKHFLNISSNSGSINMILFGSEYYDAENENMENNNMTCVEGGFNKLHFYIITNSCAKFFLRNITTINLQIDVMIGKLNSWSNKIKIYNFKNCGLRQNNKFKSDVRYVFIKRRDLDYFRLGNNILDIIYGYLPNENDLNHNFDDDWLIEHLNLWTNIGSTEQELINFGDNIFSPENFNISLN